MEAIQASAQVVETRFETTATETTPNAIVELNDLQLALVGGGEIIVTF